MTAERSGPPHPARSALFNLSAHPQASYAYILEACTSCRIAAAAVESTGSGFSTRLQSWNSASGNEAIWMTRAEAAQAANTVPPLLSSRHFTHTPEEGQPTTLRSGQSK